jgi:hypothetical protein
MHRILEAAKKKKSQSEPRHQTTPNSAPTRGANQDQSGVNVKNDNADYTISDSVNIHLEKAQGMHSKATTALGRAKTHDAKVRASTVAAQHMQTIKKIKNQMRVAKESIDEATITGTTPNSKPTSSSQPKAANAPASAAASQAAANAATAQKMRASEEAKRKQEEDRKRQEAERKAAADKAKAASPKPPTAPKPTAEELELDEARGRPKANPTAEDPGSDNIIMQLRKVISLRGQAPVKFVDGKKSMMNPGTAHRLLTMYDNLKTSGEKHSFAARIHRSSDSLRDVLAGKKETHKPKISLGGSQHGSEHK